MDFGDCVGPRCRTRPDSVSCPKVGRYKVQTFYDSIDVAIILCAISKKITIEQDSVQTKTGTSVKLRNQAMPGGCTVLTRGLTLQSCKGASACRSGD